MDYYIKINGNPVPVTEEVYKAYCRGERKERYFRESDIRNQTLFYDALDTDEIRGSDMFGDPFAESVEETAERRWLLERLKEAACGVYLGPLRLLALEGEDKVLLDKPAGTTVRISVLFHKSDIHQAVIKRAGCFPEDITGCETFCFHLFEDFPGIVISYIT